MSSRLMPPKPGAIASTVATIASGSFVSRQIGKASTPANSLKSIALPSITGIAAPRARCRRGRAPPAVAHHGDRVALDRVLERLVGVGGDRRADARHARRVGAAEVVARAQRVLRADLELAADVHAERAVRPVHDLGARRRLDGLDDPVLVRLVARVDGDVAHRAAPRRPRSRSTSPIVPPASPIAVATRPSMPGRWSMRTRSVSENWAEVGGVTAARPYTPRSRTAPPRVSAAMADAPRELFLIDGNSLAYRAFFALPESIATSDGRPTNAIFGFASMLVKILTDHGDVPTVVVWDAGLSGRKEISERLQGPALVAARPAQAAVAAPAPARRGLRLPQRVRRGLRGRRRDRRAGRAGAARRGSR